MTAADARVVSSESERQVGQRFGASGLKVQGKPVALVSSTGQVVFRAADGRVAELAATGIGVDRASSSRWCAAEYLLERIYSDTYNQAVAALAVLDVIAEPTRRRILDVVRDGERSVSELVDAVGMHQPGVSRHLKVLRDAGLVEVRRDAQRRLYRLRPEPLIELDAWLKPYRATWATGLDSLEQHLRRTAKPITSSAEEGT